MSRRHRPRRSSHLRLQNLLERESLGRATDAEKREIDCVLAAMDRAGEVLPSPSPRVRAPGAAAERRRPLLTPSGRRRISTRAPVGEDGRATGTAR